MTTKLYSVPETNVQKDKIEILLNKISSLLEIGLNSDTEFCTRSHLHNYLYIISDLFGELEDEIGGILK